MEPWEQNQTPESTKVSEGLASREDGYKFTVGKTFHVDWEDKLWAIGNKLFGWIWRK